MFFDELEKSPTHGINALYKAPSVKSEWPWAAGELLPDSKSPNEKVKRKEQNKTAQRLRMYIAIICKYTYSYLNH